MQNNDELGFARSLSTDASYSSSASPFNGQLLFDHDFGKNLKERRIQFLVASDLTPDGVKNLFDHSINDCMRSII